MGLLQKLKSVLGLDRTGSSAPEVNRDVDVTVERDPSTEDEDAVKGTDTATTQTTTAGTAAEAGPESTAGSTQADGTATTAPPTTVDDGPSADTKPTESDDGSPASSDEGSTAPVTDVKGIGPAYADRLADIGIETTGELAAASAADIAADTDLSESRVSGWIERADGS